MLQDFTTIVSFQDTCGGEFEAMRRMESSAVTRFLVQWKPVKTGCSVMMVSC